MPSNMYGKIVKPFIDKATALLMLVIFMPLFVIIGIIIKLESAGPVLFRQQRYGRNKVPFDCIKFRTMHEDAPAASPTRLLNSHDYLTFSGRILRRIGFDELPQLINVLRGEMSLLGPRPVVLAEKDLITERDKYGANNCMPGIGGWAQSNGRDQVDIKQKAHLDGEYAQNFGWRMDLSCLWRTLIAVFTSRGFKEGGFGDTAYKRKVQRNTHRITFAGRVVRRVKRDVETIKKQPAIVKSNLSSYRKKKSLSDKNIPAS